MITTRAHIVSEMKVKKYVLPLYREEFLTEFSKLKRQQTIVLIQSQQPISEMNKRAKNMLNENMIHVLEQKEILS